MTRIDRTTLISVLVLSAAVLLLYTPSLGRALYLHYDEVYFAIQAHAIAATGHDTNGRLLPAYFEATSGSWFQPAVVYFTALFLQVLPISETSLRFPTVVVALVDVILIYFIAKRTFGRNSWAMVAGFGLMLTPAHVLFGRLALSYLYPVLAVEGWFLLLMIFLERQRRWQLFLAVTCLGFGFFTYIAAVAMMPLYVAITLIVLWSKYERPWLLMALAAAGFAWPVLLSLPFHVMYPDVVLQKLGTYGPTGIASRSLDPMQHASELFTYNNLSYRVGLFFSFFNPGYLFMSGAGNVANSTRRAGVFLMPLFVFIPIGIYQLLRHRRTIMNILIVVGFVTAPLAASLVAESEATDRELEVLPFGVLLATFGIQYLWSAPLKMRLKSALTPLAAAGFATGLAYALFTLVRRGAISRETPLLLAVSVLIYLWGVASDATRQWRPTAVFLILLGLVQFQGFYRDYLTDYPIRAAGWLMNNRRGAMEEVFSRVDPNHPGQVFVSSNIIYADSYWELYSAILRRNDLRSSMHYFDPARTKVDDIPDGALVLATTTAAADTAFLAQAQLTQLRIIPERDGSPIFVLFQKRKV